MTINANTILLYQPFTQTLRRRKSKKIALTYYNIELIVEERLESACSKLTGC
jgi:hypothetical protein